MNIDPHIFKGYDIRAIYPTEIDEEKIKVIVTAIYNFFKKDQPEDKSLDIVVGTDMRTSSPSLTKVAIETLVKLGAHVIDIGMVSTPTFYFAVSHYGYECGMQITASHNPKEYNGVKFVKKGTHGLIKIGKSTGMDEVKQMVMEGVTMPEVPGGTVTKKDGVLVDEVENALKIVGNPEIKKFKIVVDPANAMGSQYIGALFDKVPQDLVKMNWELDGTFPSHQPDPLQPKNLVDLQKKVVEEHADLGLAPDGDGDRLFFIDEKGNVVPPTIITSIVTSELLKDNPGDTVYVDIRYLFTPKKIIEEKGGKMVVTKVGHAFITEAMNDSGGVFAGESSAHYFFRATGNAESQMPVILTVLKVLSREGKPFSEIVEEYRRSYESGENNFEVSNAPEILTALKEKYKDGELEDMDGIAISYPDWRFSVRTSNTEPLLRLNVEAYEKEVMQKNFDELMSTIKSLAKE
ncbi:MAG TPA: phosphomannomutase/phosphoglucomutase [Patescibacteria group bacterium]|nr:phosphomannomutase/phosphoglucomutase [Patescibacteria group bacterium]